MTDQAADDRKVYCPFERYKDAWVILPEEFLGEHALRRDEIVRAAAHYKSADLSNLAVSIALCDDWGNIPGIPGKDYDNWDLRKTPVSIIAWLTTLVLDAFNKQYIVPKAP